MSLGSNLLKRDSDTQPQDLGFGAILASQKDFRLLNKDGSFNVMRQGIDRLESLNLYQSLVRIGWWKFLAIVLLVYLGINFIFAGLYLACGSDSISGDSEFSPFLKAFFFSVQTFATIGYGQLTPKGLAANFLVAFEALAGLMTFALATGLLYARFSRPGMKLIFSQIALIAPYRGSTSLQFRLTNPRKSQVVELKIKVILALFEGEGAARKRNFHVLNLERDKISFLPLSWTVVHPIDSTSPISDFDRDKLIAADAELLILLSAFDETFSQTVHTRTSYKASEVVWGAKFADQYIRTIHGVPLGIDVGKLSEYTPV